MGLKRKKVNIMGAHEHLREGCHKSNILGGFPKKGYLDNFQGAWQKGGRKLFLREVDTPMQAMT